MLNKGYSLKRLISLAYGYKISVFKSLEIICERKKKWIK